MKKKLCWNVFIRDFNSKKIVAFDIFTTGGFTEWVKKDFKQYKKDLKKENITKKEQDKLLKDLKERIRTELMYFFWSKYEWEIGITEPFAENINDERGFAFLKTDAYSQVMLNYDVFFDYVYDCLTK